MPVAMFVELKSPQSDHGHLRRQRRRQLHTIRAWFAEAMPPAMRMEEMALQSDRGHLHWSRHRQPYTALACLAGPVPLHDRHGRRHQRNSTHERRPPIPQPKLIPPSRDRCEINAYSRGILTLDIGLGRTFQWGFVVAEVACPILGADFLHEFNLDPDLRGRSFVDATTSHWTRGTTGYPVLLQFASIPVSPKCICRHLLQQLPQLTRPTNPAAQHDATYRTRTLDPIFASNNCRTTESEFQKKLQQSTIRSLENSWASISNPALHPSYGCATVAARAVSVNLRRFS